MVRQFYARAAFFFALSFFIGIGIGVFVPDEASAADTAADIQKQIDEHNAQIDALDKEISNYQKELSKVGEQKQTLQGEIKQLDLSRKKITADISKTQNNIDKTKLQLEVLSNNIEDKEASIDLQQSGLVQALKSSRETGEITMLEAFIANQSLGDMWNKLSMNAKFQGAVQQQIDALAKAKASLEDSKAKTEAKKRELVSYQGDLTAQKTSLDINRKETANLLATTKSQEANYQAILAQKKKAKQQFESALDDLQDKLKFTLDPSSIPAAGKGVLQWPLDKVKITQKFGYTDFAKSGAYSGNQHNGVDFAASVGTPIRAALSGTVMGTGNTDAYPGCYSYGKWVLIKHDNGLSSLYGHLSQINVSAGQSVGTGSVIGFSGSTGYATGPHLHFTVYAAGAVKIQRLGDFKGSKSPCSSAAIPVSAVSGYLNPLDYL